MEQTRCHTGLIMAMGAVLLTGGCAVMSESQCKNADWYLVGEQDGRAGETPARLSKYYETCAEYGITPDRDKYTAGYEQGLTFYCTAQNGYQQGRGGRQYQGVCPQRAQINFMIGYELGALVRSAAENVERIERRVSKFEEDVRNLKREIETAEAPPDSDETDKEKKDSDDTAASTTLKEKYRDLGRLEGTLEELLERKRRAISRYRFAVDEARGKGFFEAYAY